MPRTFSRGKKFSWQLLLLELPKFLPESENEAYQEAGRLQFCREPGLEEIDILDLLKDLIDLKDFLKRFTSHLEEFHDDQSHLAANSRVGEARVDIIVTKTEFILFKLKEANV